MSTALHHAVQQAQDGRNETAIARVPSGWVLMGDAQTLPGYCLLVADPVAGDLHELAPAARQQFLGDMALLGEALIRLPGAARVNYEILGNSTPALHAHLFARYAHEPDELRRQPVWRYSSDAWRAVPFHRATHLPLMRRIAEELSALGAEMTWRC